MIVGDGVQLPFEGLPQPAAALALAAFVTVVVMFCWNMILAVLAARWEETRRAMRRDGEQAMTRDVDPVRAPMWVFLVPALDEEATIADSVLRLAQTRAERSLIVVINDGSTDATAAVLAGLDVPELVVLHRAAPDARRGKAAALNDAWRRLDTLLAERAIDRDDVVTCVVDADGRLDPRAPEVLAPTFADPRVGGVQVLVRIYNRDHLLTRMQDLEFRVMDALYQAGRSMFGCAGMGGNGQFNRLVALDELVAADERAARAGSDVGPWRDRLTEDQDLGLRLLLAGWRSVQEHDTFVDQQGVPGLRALYRQRTRWSQGNLQAMSLIPAFLRSRRPERIGARLEVVLSLLMPIWQSIVGAALVMALVLFVLSPDQFGVGGSLVQMAFYYLLGFGATLVGCALQGWRTHGVRGLLLGLVVAHPYAIYTWIIWPVLIRAAARMVLRRGSWAKTRREAVAAADAP